MAMRVFVLDRRRRPEEDDRVGLGKLSPDVGLDCGPSSVEGNASGDEKAPVLPVALDLVLPLRVVT